MSDVREEIYYTYKKDIFSYFYKATLNYHNAEDLTEEVRTLIILRDVNGLFYLYKC